VSTSRRGDPTTRRTLTAAAAESFAVAHASPDGYVAALRTEPEDDEWVIAEDFIAAPAVLLAARRPRDARAEVDRIRAEARTSISDAFGTTSTSSSNQELVAKRLTRS
jgi:hypothetical protein